MSNWQIFFLISGVGFWLVILAVVAYYSVSCNFVKGEEINNQKLIWFFNFSVFGFGIVLAGYENEEVIKEDLKHFDRHSFVYFVVQKLIVGFDYPKWVNAKIVRTCSWKKLDCNSYVVGCLDSYQLVSDIPNPPICHHCNKPIKVTVEG